MQRIVAGFRKPVIGGRRQEDVGRLHADLELEEVVVFQNAGVFQRALDQRLRAGLPVFLQQVALEAAGIDADAHRASVVLRRLYHLAHARGRADIAGIDAQAGRSRLRRLDGPAVVEVDVGDDGNADFRHDLRERRGALLVGTGHPDDVRARQCGPAHLRDRRGDVAGQRVGHGLDADRGIAADLDRPDPDFPGGPAIDVTIWTNAHEAPSGCLSLRDRSPI